MSSDSSPHLSATREIRAAGPSSDAEALRTAYLDLLKLTLCDLASARTESVIWNGKDSVRTRPLEGEELKRRVVGQDWPLNGLTMVGLDRLDDLQRCVESVIADGVEGDLIEAGTWRGGSSILMRATLDTLGATDRKVWLADSFQGFPAPDEDGFPEDPKLDPLSGIDYLAARLEDVRSYFARFGLEDGLEFVPGFFENTLPELRGQRWAIARLDGDTYKATWLSLEALYSGLARGGYMVVDDYGYIEACRRAVNDFRDEHGITEPLEEIDWNGARWRRESAPDESPDEAPARPAVARPVDRERGAAIPSERELELGAEIERREERIAALEREVERLRATPLAGPKEWAARRRAKGRS